MPNNALRPLLLSAFGHKKSEIYLYNFLLPLLLPTKDSCTAEDSMNVKFIYI